MRRSGTKKLRVDLGESLRRLGRDVGLGVVEALQERPTQPDPNLGWRGEQLAVGAVRGIDSRSTELQTLAEDVARAFARGAFDELRTQLGEGGEGPLTKSLGASASEVGRTFTHGLARPLTLLGLAIGVGFVSVLLMRRA